MPLNVDELITEIKDVTSSILQKDVTTVSGFSERQLKGIAQQASLVADGIASNQITEETRDFFLSQLVEVSRNFARTVGGMALVTFEKIWNAVVTAIWKALQAAVGQVLPIPT